MPHAWLPLAAIFELEQPLLHLFARGVVVYIALAVILRLMPKRQSGELAPNDLIALVIVGNLAGLAIAGASTGALDLLLLITIILFLDYLSNLLEYYFPRLRHVAQDSPTLLIHNGTTLRQNLRREKLTEEELASSLRKQGILDVAQIKQAVMEVDGRISVIRADDATADKPADE